MARKTRNYSNKTIRTLFAKSGNQCAFPTCEHILVDAENDFLGHICHIEAVSAGGPRYNPKISPNELDSVNNLIVLCYDHHAKIDRHPDQYTVECLTDMKQKHEGFWERSSYNIPNEAIDQIQREHINLKHEIACENEKWNDYFSLAMPFNLSDDPQFHLDEVKKSFSDLEKILGSINNFSDSLADEIGKFLDELGYDTKKYRDVPYYTNPFFNPLWETMALGSSNVSTKLSIHLTAVEYHFVNQKLKENPHDEKFIQKNHELKTELLKIASSVGYAD